MLRGLVQPVGQKRLTNVAVVRLKKHGKRFEIACFKNKVLSWRSGVEKDIDEVLQTQTVYLNVSKGVLAKSKDLMEAFGTSEEAKICLEILDKGELQIAGKERDSQFSNQFRDIATIVMDKTLNPQTERPYTISMIERFMKEIHFAVDPHRTSKKQALVLIKELQKQFPITRAHMRLKLCVALKERQKLSESLKTWQARIETQEDDDDMYTVVCKVEPGHFRSCDSLIRECEGKLEVVSMAVHREGDEEDDQEEDDTTGSQHPQHVEALIADLKKSQVKEVVSASRSQPSTQTGKRCLTCNVVIVDPTEFREHYKGSWHKHNLKRKLKQLPPLSAEECLLDTSITEHVYD